MGSEVELKNQLSDEEGEESSSGSEEASETDEVEETQPEKEQLPSVKDSTTSAKGEAGVITQQHLKYIANELGLIKLCWDDVRPPDYDGRIHYPPSYLSNSEKEKILLWYAENFRQQFTMNYPKRRPLLLACDNECGIQKMVCTTIRPTTMKYPEFQTWQGCASFVSDYIKYEQMDSPTVLPDRINSPAEVLHRQSGHSFECATLLASFLIGSAYDAYVVSGYATREICANDQNFIECPYLVDEEKEEEVVEEQVSVRYALKEPPDLRSKFLLAMEEKEAQKERDAILAQELAELEAIREFEKPWPDELWGWRLHSWVLVLPSKDITSPIFIECSTGSAKDVSDPEYHGIESVWNHLNYWALIQFENKTDTCEDINFDLNDDTCWAHLLIGEPFTNRLLPPEMMEADAAEMERNWIEAEKHLDMPASWVNELELSHSDYEKRYPKSKKKINYRKCISEQFAPYVHPDGLLHRVTTFHDYECLEERKVREVFANRADLMYYREKLIDEDSVLEKFHRGRDDALKEHFYYVYEESRFEVKFYDEARFNGLSRLLMDPRFLTQYYEKRPDFLSFRQVEFDQKEDDQMPLRDILKITERYDRNPKLEANEDISTVEYLLAEKRIHLKFHYEPMNMTYIYRTYEKPPAVEAGEKEEFDMGLTSGYLTGPMVPEPKPLQLYREMMKYLEKEGITVNAVKETNLEISNLLKLRSHELAMPRLSVSVYDVERNVEAKKCFKMKEEAEKEAKMRDLGMSCDFLAPYYAKLGEPPGKVLSASEAEQMVRDCLQDWKGLLVARANEIQQQFEQACQDLNDKNNWYDRSQGVLTKEQEEEYFEYCKRHIIHLHALEERLNRHRDLAPQRYLSMVAYLRADPRLAAVFEKKKKKRRIL